MESDYAALYAVAGLTDALAEALKGALADTQQKASKRLTELQSKRPELSKQAKAGADELRTFVITLPEQFKQLPEATKARIAELQKQANDLLAQATATYGDFAGRGKQAVDEVRKSTHDGSSKATRTVTPGVLTMPQTGPQTETGKTPRRIARRRPTQTTPHAPPPRSRPREQERWGVSSPPPG